LQLTVGILVVVALVVLWLVVFPSDGSPPPEPSAVTNPNLSTPAEVVFPVEVAVARRGDLIKRLTTSGIIRAKREVELVARISGEIVAVPVKNGHYVREGELLVKLDDREHRVAFEKARAALLAAQIEYKQLSAVATVGAIDSAQIREQIVRARETYQRAEGQFERGEISEEEFARARRDYEADIAYFSSKRGDLVANKSGLTQAQEMFERAKMNLEWTELRAPFSGYVANCRLNEHMQVQAGNVLLTLVDISSLLVDVEVLESEIGNIVVGREAEASVTAYPHETFSGSIVAINPLVDPKTKTVKVTVELKDSRPKRSSDSRFARQNLRFLRPGMYATVRLVSDVFRSRLCVPKEALLVRDQRTLVFVAQEGLAKWHYVEVGEENEELIEIKSGIAVGDTVIVAGHYTLAHDARIRVIQGEK
jgi:RND family efflux transporter MFP subunit